MNIEIEDIIKNVAPQLQVVAIEADVINCDTPDDFWTELTQEALRIAQLYDLSQINKRPGIAATRAAYKALGKEPNRYRPSSEALCRRAVKGMELYRINALVDIINLISMRSGYSIGGFDADCIQGDLLRLGAGRTGEVFNAIGRGQLNIEGLPLYRDAVGGIGTPTSDEERTKLSIATRRLLMCINIYQEEMPVGDVVNLSRNLLERYCQATNITVKYVRP
ncbi:MAG: hypothetical protein IKA19_01375 [Muribaculaceae bacterium]|nr:hypothetical protein [Muribaculaceae bacterium]